MSFSTSFFFPVFTSTDADKTVFKKFAFALIHSFLQPQELIFTRAKRAFKFLVIMGTNKPFENSNHYFTWDRKHCDARYKRRNAIVTKCERKVLYFKEAIVGPKYFV